MHRWGEYSVTTDLPDRNAFARWLDQTIAHARLSDTGCAVLLIHIADFREVDEVFEVRADDISPGTPARWRRPRWSRTTSSPGWRATNSPWACRNWCRTAGPRS